MIRLAHTLPAAALIALGAGPADAFYFPTSWPGMRTPTPPPTILQPGLESPVIMEVAPPQPISLPPTDLLELPTLEVTPTDVPPTPSPPEVPEPATLTLGAIGLAALVLKRRK